MTIDKALVDDLNKMYANSGVPPNMQVYPSNYSSQNDLGQYEEKQILLMSVRNYAAQCGKSNETALNINDFMSYAHSQNVQITVRDNEICLGSDVFTFDEQGDFITFPIPELLTKNLIVVDAIPWFKNIDEEHDSLSEYATQNCFSTLSKCNAIAKGQNDEYTWYSLATKNTHRKTRIQIALDDMLEEIIDKENTQIIFIADYLLPNETNVLEEFFRLRFGGVTIAHDVVTDELIKRCYPPNDKENENDYNHLNLPHRRNADGTIKYK